MAANGKLDPSTLTKVDGWAYLTHNAAAAWERGCDDIVALGYPRPTITVPDGAYRTMEGQQYWKAFWATRGLPNNAATPGYSGHGWATDVDIWNVAKFPHAVLVEVFGKYGFTFNVASESWHMHHNGMAVATLSATPITEWKIMAHAVVVQAQTDPHFNWIAVVTENGQLHEVDPTERAWWNDLAACYDPTLEATSVTEQQYKTFVAANQPQSGAAAASELTGTAVEHIVQASEGRIISAIPKTFRAA